MVWVRRILFFGGWRAAMVAGAIAVLASVLLYVPAALAFPHRAQIGVTTIYSVAPITPALDQHLARADALLAASPINEPGLARTIVLTDGGWRWRVMAFGHSGTVALRRPFASTLIFNRSDLARDRVAGVRTLSGTIAHEMTHVLTARRYGEWRLIRMPAWKREGYADYVADETRAGGESEAQIRARDPDAPVLAYFEGRRRVAAELARNGGSVDRLMTD